VIALEMEEVKRNIACSSVEKLFSCSFICRLIGLENVGWCLLFCERFV